MNAVVTFDASVPAFLRNANFLQLNQKATAGLSTGAPPRLSFRGSRFRFIAADGTETPLPAEGQPGNNSISVDVIVLDASEFVSKFYYDKAYDPNADDMSPACFSDNGVGPSVRAAKPQALLCQGCDKNAWGSKITPTGSSVKACSDIKKVAVIPLSNVEGPAFALNIPAASLKTWTAAVNAVTQRGIPIPALVFRLGFDPDPAFPKLTFSPVSYINEQQAAAIQDLFGSDECADLVGRKDTPIQALPAGAGGSNAAPAPAGAPAYAGTQPAQPVYATAPATGGHGAATPFNPPQAQPAPAFLQQAAAPVQEAAPRRRGRPARTEQPAQQAPAMAQQPAPPFAAAPAAPVQQTTAASAMDLNAMLDKVMAS